MNRPILLLYAFFSLSFFTLRAEEGSYEIVDRFWQTKKRLTFLVYIAADNDLAPFVDQDLNEMKKIGSSNRLNILVYLNTKTVSGIKITRKLLIKKGNVVQIGQDELHDSGQAEAVIDACRWAHTDFPSKQFALVLWDHGSGSINRSALGQRSWLWDVGDTNEASARAVCYDDTTGNYLTDQKLIEALSTVCTKYRRGRKIDILAFDACLMADIEVAYTVAPYVNYMVASQETIPGKGFGYQHVLKGPSQWKLSSFDLARKMTRAYRKEYLGRSPDFTLSALDLSWIRKAVSNVNEISRLLKELLENSSDSSTVRHIIHESKSRRNCLQFSDETYLDMQNFYLNLFWELGDVTLSNEDKKEQLLSLLHTGQQIIRNCVIANVFGRDYDTTCGLSIYFRRKTIDYTYPELKWSQDMQWLPFLQAYDNA